MWQRLADLYPNRWITAVGVFDPASSAVRAWREKLADVTPRQLANGLKSLSGEWPPSATEFRDLCLAAIAIPTEQAAYVEACRAAGGGGYRWAAHAWSHPVVYAAAKAVGIYQLSHTTEFTLRGLFREEYRRVMARYRAGEQFDAPAPLRLVHERKDPDAPRRTPQSERRGQEAIAALYKFLEDKEQGND